MAVGHCRCCAVQQTQNDAATSQRYRTYSFYLENDMSDVVKFPIEAEMKVVIANGESFGVATIGLGYGGFPTEKEVQERIQRFEREELAGLQGYRLATAPELWDYACLEKAGQTFATPAAYREFAPIDA